MYMSNYTPKLYLCLNSIELHIQLGSKTSVFSLFQVQEWFKNRRKIKDKLGQERMLGRHLPKGRRGQRSSSGSIGGISEIGHSHSLEQQVAMVMEGGVAMETEGVWQ